MTVIPLVAALAITSVASASDSGLLGRIGGRALVLFVVLLVAGGVFTALVAPVALGSLSFTADAAASLRASVDTTAAAPASMPTVVETLIEMIPRNPLAAAANGDVLPVVVFSIFIGLAASRLGAESREAFLGVFRALVEVMLTMVGWILRIAPLGVFALSLVLGMRVGIASAGALAHYIVTLCAILLAFTLALYPIVVILGRVSPRRFAVAALPAQAVAFSVRSSLASLPAQIAGARDTLGLSQATTGFVLPLAVSVFRVNVPIAWVVGVLFLGELYGVDITSAQLAMLIVTSTLLSFSVPGIPSASLFLLAPVLVQNGIPPEGVGILIAVDAIPDMFKTLVNVTAHMTSATILDSRVSVSAGAGGAMPAVPG
jgi:Na+/H+-dicarboxylate symporter